MTKTPEDFRGNRVWVPDRPRPKHLERLYPLGLEVEDATGVKTYDPNSITLSVIVEKMTSTLRPIDGRKSICSGEPAVIYRNSEAEIALTPEELRRLVLLALTPDEFTAICNEVGAIYELHDDFYDPDTGFALQPKTDVPGEDPRAFT